MPTETRKTCARPGCQHDALVHDGYGCRGRAGVRDLRRDAEVRCSCPSYRTQAQQEAWDVLRITTQYERPEDFATAFQYIEALKGAALRVLELYP
jgi:hypothetical protein